MMRYALGLVAASALGLGIASAQEITRGGPPMLTGYAVASLPTGAIGMVAYVTDQITACPAKNVAPTAGGALKCTVFYNGTAWVGI